MMNSTEQKISRSFVRLLEDTPIERVTIAEICAEAGVSKRSFYNHFCDKYDIINKTHIIPVFENETEGSLDALENYFRRYYKKLLEHRGFVRNISFYYGQNSPILSFRDHVRDLLWQVMKNNHPDLTRTPELEHAVEYFAGSYILFIVRIVLLDEVFCEEYFRREHFIKDYIPLILLPYLY